MIIFWSGFGFVVPVVALLSMALAQVITDAVMGNDYYTIHSWPKTTACFITGIILWYLGRWMNKPWGGVFVNKDTGEEFQTSPNHSFFFIPVEYWSFAVMAFGLYMATM